MIVAFGVPSAEHVTINAGHAVVQRRAGSPEAVGRRHLALGSRSGGAIRGPPRSWRLQEHLVDLDLDGQARSGNGPRQRRGQLRFGEEGTHPFREALASAPGDVDLRGPHRRWLRYRPLT